jgi:hypothetical protein
MGRRKEGREGRKEGREGRKEGRKEGREGREGRKGGERRREKKKKKKKDVANYSLQWVFAVLYICSIIFYVVFFVRVLRGSEARVNGKH